MFPGNDYVVSSNGAASPNNKLNLYKLDYDGTSLAKKNPLPLIYQSSLIKAISSVGVLDF
jgi:hypothetical protein